MIFCRGLVALLAVAFLALGYPRAATVKGPDGAQPTGVPPQTASRHEAEAHRIALDYVNRVATRSGAIVD